MGAGYTCCTNKEVTQMSRYFTKTLAALEPYTPGEQLKLPDLVKLNANENPYPPAPGVAAAVAGAVPGLRLYSDLTEAALCAAIARHCGVQPENILCGNRAAMKTCCWRCALSAMKPTRWHLPISPTAFTRFCAICCTFRSM